MSLLVLQIEMMNVSQKALFTLRTLALSIFSLPSVRPPLSLSSRLLFSRQGVLFVSLVACINKAQTKSLDKQHRTQKKCSNQPDNKQFFIISWGQGSALLWSSLAPITLISSQEEGFVVIRQQCALHVYKSSYFRIVLWLQTEEALLRPNSSSPWS